MIYILTWLLGLSITVYQMYLGDWSVRSWIAYPATFVLWPTILFIIIFEGHWRWR